MTGISLWLKNHATAILATGVAVSKAGLLGKAALVIVTAICGA